LRPEFATGVDVVSRDNFLPASLFDRIRLSIGDNK
jgi:hypothetical protein